MARGVKFMPYPQFDRRQLDIQPLGERVHDMTLDHLLQLGDPVPPVDDPALPSIADRIVHARQAGRPVILLMGGHVIKQGLSRQVIDLMEVLRKSLKQSGGGDGDDASSAQAPRRPARRASGKRRSTAVRSTATRARKRA